MRLINSKNPLLDWPTENEENGNYEGYCTNCKQSYIGPKHSFSCFLCYTESKNEWDNMTELEKRERTLAVLEAYEIYKKNQK